MQAVKRRQLIYETVQEEIKAYIIEHSLKPGDSIPPEAELAQRLGVSRNSVREALKSLETLGILDARPGAGLFVRDFSFDPLLNNFAYGIAFDLKELTDIIEVRFHIEYSMLRRALHVVTPEQIEALHAILQQMHVAAQDGKYEAEADRAFHQTLWNNVDNVVVGKILDVFWMVHHQARKRDSIADPPDPLYTWERHVSIVEAIEKRDLKAAQIAMVRHYAAFELRLHHFLDFLAD